jgi:PKD repeat protein
MKLRLKCNVQAEIVVLLLYNHSHSDIMKKIFLLFALVFLMHKSFGQCTTVTPGGPFIVCSPACVNSLLFSSVGGTPPYSLYINSVFITTYTSMYAHQNVCPGTYVCVITDASMTCSDTVNVTFTTPPPISLTLNVTNATCSSCCDGSITANLGGGNPPFNYIWSNGNFTPTASNACVGLYSITVTDANGCSASASVAVGVGTCAASFAVYPSGNPHDYWVVNNSTGAPTISYDWDWGDATPHSTVAFPTHTYASAGYYNITLTITDGVGCTNMQTYNSYLARAEQMLTVTVVPQLPASVPELTEGDISVYPNPATDVLTIVGHGELTLLNALGEKVLQTQIQNSKSEFSIGNLLSGIYFIKVSDGEKTTVKKVVKM